MKRNTHRGNRLDNLNELLMLSAWGGVLVIASILFFFVGMRIDEVFETGPVFMVGMLVLAVFLIVARLYTEYKKTDNRMGNLKDRHA
ncbi:MAG TPA: AtpZ/AtpI family protein [Deltaproteobacteria bacterium]|nr:AtpZ/AtpI family protein [Deltaproteobacteria bacterium]